MALDKKSWIVQGIFFGLFMFVFMTLFNGFFLEVGFQAKKLLLSLPIWLVGGLLYGYILKVTKSLPK